MNASATEQDETARYAEQWQVRERLVAVFIGLAVSLIPITVVLIAVLHSDTVVGVVWAVWAVGMVATRFWLWVWPCPRCRAPFHQGRLGWLASPSMFRVRCIQCGLARPVYTEHGRALVRGALDDPKP